MTCRRKATGSKNFRLCTELQHQFRYFLEAADGHLQYNSAFLVLQNLLFGMQITTLDKTGSGTFEKQHSPSRLAKVNAKAGA